jgi:hypothetical protein
MKKHSIRNSSQKISLSNSYKQQKWEIDFEKMAKTAKVQPTAKFARWKVEFRKTCPNTIRVLQVTS